MGPKEREIQRRLRVLEHAKQIGHYEQHGKNLIF